MNDFNSEPQRIWLVECRECGILTDPAKPLSYDETVVQMRRHRAENNPCLPGGREHHPNVRVKA